jgi:hypothetical protein
MQSISWISASQQQVLRKPCNCDPSFIRRELTKANVSETNWRAIFIGA